MTTHVIGNSVGVIELCANLFVQPGDVGVGVGGEAGLLTRLGSQIGFAALGALFQRRLLERC